MAVLKAPRWYGSAESEMLEYKSFEAMKHRETIVRAVVALLNHRGGHVVVGVDDDGRPEEATTRPVDEGQRLQHAIVDAIEPRPLDLVAVRHVDVDGRRVIEVEVQRAPRERRPYAERRHGFYGFWIRSGPTTRALSVAEVREAWGRTAGELVPELERWDAPLVHENEAATVLVLHAQLLEGEQKFSRAGLERVLGADRRGSLSRRPMGWTVVDEYDRVERRGPNLEVGTSGERKWLRFDVRKGIVRFEARTDFLRWKAPPALAQEPVLYPFPLVEGTASFFWLLAAYGDEQNLNHGTVRCSLGLWRPQGLRLGPQRPGVIAWDWGAARWQPPHDNTSVERTDDFAWSALREANDRIASTFVHHVYEDFGYDEQDVPFWSLAESKFVFGQ